MNTKPSPTPFRFLALATLLVLFAGALVAAPQEALNVKVKILSGQVRLVRAGASVSEVAHDIFPVYAGDIIETLSGTKAMVLYSDGTQMRLKPQTKVQIEANALRVFKGKAWFKFTKRGSEFVIDTPSLVAGIRGTEFDVNVTSRCKTILNVMEGKVGVRANRKDSSETLIGAGQGTTCDFGREPAQPIAIEIARKQTEWNHSEWKLPADLNVDDLLNQAERNKNQR